MVKNISKEIIIAEEYTRNLKDGDLSKRNSTQIQSSNNVVISPNIPKEPYPIKKSVF